MKKRILSLLMVAAIVVSIVPMFAVTSLAGEDVPGVDPNGPLSYESWYVKDYSDSSDNYGINIYDENGNKIYESWACASSSSKYEETAEIRYDENNIEVYTVSNNGEFKTVADKTTEDNKTVYFYKKYENNSGWERTYNDTKCEYDTGFNLIKEIGYSGIDSVYYETVYTYNAKGLLEKEVCTYCDNSSEVTEYTYNAEDKKTQESIIGYTSEQTIDYTETIAYTYEDNKIIEEQMSDYGFYKFVDTLDKNGNIIQTDSYSKYESEDEYELISRRNFTFDSLNREISNNYYIADDKGVLKDELSSESHTIYAIEVNSDENKAVCNSISDALELPHYGESAENPTKIVLTSDVEDSFVIPKDRYVEIDLNGFTLKNDSENEVIADISGNLTIQNGDITQIDNNQTSLFGVDDEAAVLTLKNVSIKDFSVKNIAAVVIVKDGIINLDNVIFENCTANVSLITTFDGTINVKALEFKNCASDVATILCGGTLNLGGEDSGVIKVYGNSGNEGCVDVMIGGPINLLSKLKDGSKIGLALADSETGKCIDGKVVKNYSSYYSRLRNVFACENPERYLGIDDDGDLVIGDSPREGVCEYVDEVQACKDARLIIGTKDAGEVDVIKVGDNEYQIINEDGKYIALRDTTVVLRDEPFTWSYDGGLYRSVETKNDFRFLWFKWSRTQFVKHYLLVEDGELVTTVNYNLAYVKLTSTHKIAYTVTECHHTVYCAHCGETLEAECKHEYDEDTQLCECGKRNPDYCIVTKATVDYTVKSKTRGFWFWKTTIVSHIYNFNFETRDTFVKKVEYSTNEKNWTIGICAAYSDKQEKIYLRITDGYDHVTRWVYDAQTGETTPAN